MGFNRLLFFYETLFLCFVYEKFREADDIFSTHKQLTDFLENRARTHDAAQASSGSNGSLNFNNRSSATVNTTSPKRSVPSCPLCSGESHYLSRCSKFLQMDVPQRRNLMTSHPGTCYNCLGPGHQPSKCPSKRTCLTCSEQHHTLLHQWQLICSNSSNFSSSNSCNLSGSNSSELSGSNSGKFSSSNSSKSRNLSIHRGVPDVGQFTAGGPVSTSYKTQINFVQN